MSFQSKKYTVRFADSADDEGIREVFESGSFAGGLNVQYLRNPKPFESFLADGHDAKIIVATDNADGRIVGVGGAVVRMEFIHGKAEKCAYLTGLKLRPDYQRRFPFIAKAYSLLREAVEGCKCYTTVLDDNAAAIALFEKKHRNMPEYRYLGHYTTYCFHGGKKMIDVEKNNLEGFDALMETHFKNMDFTPADYCCKGFGEKNFYCARENGEITACCFVGNQQALKQYKICSYGGMYRILAKFPTRLLQYPAFPKAGSILNHGVVSYLYVKDCSPALCRTFLRSVAKETDFSLLIWGGFENNPLCRALDRMRAVRYGSRVYEVVWEGAPEPYGVVGIEAALL